MLLRCRVKSACIILFDCHRVERVTANLESKRTLARDRFGFAGGLDGNGYTIRNLTINLPETGGVGLFGTLAKTGVVRNLNLENATVNGLHGTGALVGANFGYVADCTASVKVSGRCSTAACLSMISSSSLAAVSASSSSPRAACV